MTDARISNLSEEVVMTTTPSARVSNLSEEVVATYTPSARVSRLAVEVIYALPRRGQLVQIIETI